MKTMPKVSLALVVGTAIACGGGSGSTTFLGGTITLSNALGGYTGQTLALSSMTAVPVAGLLYDMNGFGQEVKVQFPTGNASSGKLYEGMAFPASTTGCVVTYSESIPLKSWVSGSGTVRVSSSDGISLSSVVAANGTESVQLDGTVTGFSNSVPAVTQAGTLELPGAQTYDTAVPTGTTTMTFTFTQSANPTVNKVTIVLPSSELPVSVGSVTRVTPGSATVGLQATTISAVVSSTNGYMSIERTSTGYNFSIVGFTTTASGVGPFNGLLRS